MLELRILGPVELHRSDGSELRVVLAQPKRLALLVYLALAAPGGFCRRDTLLALFWPELDDSHARDALKQAVRFLRQALASVAPDVLIGRGADELGIDSRALWCDAVAFQEALDAGRVEEALALYRGDLLEGFFSDTSAAFNEWLERERDRRRAGAALAARAVAEQRHREHNFTSAVTWTRRALELSGADERLLRELLSLLDRLGDRAGAVHAYEEFARWLAHEYEVEPAAETRALIAGIRSRNIARDLIPELPARSDRPPATLTADFARDAPQDGTVASVAPEVVPFTALRKLQLRLVWPRHYLLLASLLVLLIPVVVAWRAAVRARTPAKAIDAPYRVAVMPFVVRGRDDLAYLGEGMVDLLSVNLDGAGDLRSVNPRTLLSQVGRRGGASAVQDLDHARAVAADLGARAYVLGTVVGLGDRLRIAAWLYPLDRADGDTVQAIAEGEAQDVAALVDQVTRQLLLARLHGESAYFAKLAAVTTHFLPALKSYLEGEALWRARESDLAVAAFRRAVEHDSTFALAYYRLAVAGEWSLTSDPGDAVERALLHSARLPERHGRLLRALDARRRGATAEAESLYTSVLRSHPDDSEAWFQLGTLRTPHTRPWGAPIQDAREAFERALALDPGHPRAPGALSWLDGHEGLHADAVTRLRSLEKMDRGGLRPVIGTALAFARDDDAAQRKAIERLRQTADTRQILFAADFVAQRVGHLEGGIRAARVLTEPSRLAKWRAFGYVRVADIELLRGRQLAGRAALAEAQRLLPAYGLHARAYAALGPFSPVSTSELAALRDAIADRSPRSTRDSLRHDYLLGRLSVRLEKHSEALRHALRLESRSAVLERLDSTRASAMARDLALAVRADLAWQRGHRAEALSLLEQWQPEDWWVVPPTITKPDPGDIHSLSIGHWYASERWMRAALLASLGRPWEAITWYDALGFSAGEDMRYLAPSRLRMGELYERLGERERAAEQYLRFVTLWRDCDPALRPLVEDVQRRIARLQSFTGGGS